MNNFYKILNGDSTYKGLREALEKEESPQLVVGIAGAPKAHFVYSLTSQLKKPALVIMPDDISALRFCEDLNTLLGYRGAEVFPTRELMFYDTEGSSLEYEHSRIGVASKLLRGDVPIVVASGEGASLYTIPPEKLEQYTKTLKTGESYPIQELMEFLLKAGYTREAQVDGVSQFALRGGILDIFPASESEPYRIEFWGDEIDTISTFELFSQRRVEGVENIKITPVREALVENPEALAIRLEKIGEKLRGKYGKKAKENIQKDASKLRENIAFASVDKYLPLLYPKPATLLDYCGDRLMFLCEPVAVKDTMEGIGDQRSEDIKILLEEGILFSGCDTFSEDFSGTVARMLKQTTIIMDTFTRSLPEIKLAGMHSVETVSLSAWSGELAVLTEDLEDMFREGYRAVIFGGTERNCKALLSDLSSEGINARIGGDMTDVPKGTAVIVEGSLTAGVKYPQLGLALLTHQKIEAPGKRRRRHKAGRRVKEISDLKIGDYVVHASHGIGIFGGIVKRDIHGVIKDYIKITYAGTDALFVPVTQLDLVSKYIGAGEGSRVKLNRLNSTEWQKTRSRVKGAVKEMAKELTALYATRMNTVGYAFSPDGDWQQEFEQRFPYEETEDQADAAYEIKQDMEKSRPMDRLLCGDVGFGKTEVAMRAIFKCVLEGKQCAVLVPTTILAWQHFQTFTRRLATYPIKTELLSRFKTPKEQKEIIKQLKTGQVDIVIGTHRVVQKDVEFKDLGLCVIDEEQRFGVADKERFKELRASVDVLALSATPIPRTLNMALSGIRDMSIIEQPPLDRYPVQTYVMEYQEGVILQAIHKEIRRGGQVFFLHNNTQTITRRAKQLQELMPDARIAVAHGRMGEERLSDIWRQLMEQEIDVLVCTTIIETGIDVPNANTLVVENADNYGLSQLYQLRGRVGRSTRRAYAYLTFKADKALTEIATKRLEAIREFTTFGSGFQIAMRDLEIRGAGNVLGAQQHGHLESVGYDMYIKLLSEAVSEETGQPIEERTECVIDIRMDAYIPEDYIDNTSQRIDTYKRIAGVDSEEDALDAIDELIDRFGEPPVAVVGLIQVAQVRGNASKLGIAEIKQSREKIILYPEKFDIQLASSVAAAMGGRVLINAGQRPYYSVSIEKDKGPLDAIKDTLTEMSKAREDSKKG